jgi:hypothetical protein
VVPVGHGMRRAGHIPHDRLHKLRRDPDPTPPTARRVGLRGGAATHAIPSGSSPAIILPSSLQLTMSLPRAHSNVPRFHEGVTHLVEPVLGCPNFPDARVGHRMPSTFAGLVGGAALQPSVSFRHLISVKYRHQIDRGCFHASTVRQNH